MRERRRGIAANSTLAFLGDTSSKAGQLVVMVIAARTLPTPDLAVLGTALAASAIASVALDAGAGILITRDGARRRGDGGGLFVALALARLPAALIVVAAGLVVGEAIGNPAVWLAAAALAVLGAMGSSLNGLFRAQHDMRPEAVQKLLFALLAIAAAGAAAALSSTATAIAVGLAAALALSLVPLLLEARRPIRARGHARALTALRRATPLGLMAIATMFYYRSGTLALSIGSTSAETAAFTIASTIGFGLLMVPNAITTGLLPRLAAEQSPAGQIAVARRALVWTMALTVPLAGAAALLGPVVLPAVFGSRYSSAAQPLALLCGGIVLIAFSGVIGIALIARGVIRLLAFQVAFSLLINVAALVLLAPRLGANGAALATITCEVAGLALLVLIAARRLPGLLHPPRLPLGGARSPAESGVLR